MKKIIFSNFIVLLFCTIFNMFNSSLYAQSEEIGIKFSGFIKSDIMYDTRQNFAPREGHFNIWPLQEVLDADGKDINAKHNFNILNVQSRLQSKITGPEALGAKTSAYVEMEFFGSTDANINTLRLRHAFVDIDWKNTKLRAGQFWHPLFETSCFAGTIAFNTGVPFQPFSRNPQIRLIQKFGDFNFTLAAVTQRDFTSSGPNGFSSEYLRNSALPELYGGMQFNANNFLIGAGASYKTLTPRLFTIGGKDDGKYKTDETIGTYAVNAYTKFSSGLFSIKLYGVYGQNLVDLMLPGGYALKSINVEKGQETYTPFTNMSLWTDIAYGKEVEVGLFGGYGEVMGTDENTDLKTYYGRGADIGSLYRISPRIAYTTGKFRTAFEIEYTAAEYGFNDNTNKNKITDGKTVANLRGLLAFYLFF